MRQILPAAAILLVGVFGVSGVAQAQTTGRELYDAACAACHGPDGRGMPRAAVGFEIELPDFTNCSFATPEADADWLAVAHEGGPVRAFDRRMPAFGDALTREQLSSILGHVRTFCTDAAWPRGELNLPRPLVTEKAFPENEALLSTSVDLRSGSAVGQEVLYERRIGARTQAEIAVPVAAQQSQSGAWTAGLGDIAVAIKHVVAHSVARGAIFSAAAEVKLPSGRHEDGLGAGTFRFEPFVAFAKVLPRDAFVQAQAGVELSADTSRAPHEGFWRTAIGRTFTEARFGRAWSPMIELLGSRELIGGEPVHWDVVPQVQVSLSRRQHVLVGVGVRTPIDERHARGAELLTYLLWDWFDGGLFSGWR